LRDELVGFARSKVMLVLWVLLPLLALGGFLLLGGRMLGGQGLSGQYRMSAATFMSFIESSLGGTVTALMVAVDLVAERNRNVYTLFAIRPIRREAIVWAKAIAAASCVIVAAIVSIALGFAVDAVRGDPVTGARLLEAAKALLSMSTVIALSAAVGVLFGVLARSILVAVVLVLYVGQNLAVVPMLPMYLGVLPDRYWLFTAISVVLIAVVLWLAGIVFRRAQL
jgi:ABC-type transport system involved in multi-copper enzyme maturation permease subunit